MQMPYVPVLRAKQGEVNALKELAGDVKAKIRPLFELTRPTIQTRTERNKDGSRQKIRVPKELGAHLADLAKWIQSTGPGLTEIWVDDRIRRPSVVPATGKHPLTHFFASLDAPACPVIPVVGPGRDSEYLKAAVERAAEVGSLVVRIVPADLVDARGAEKTLVNFVTKAGLSLNKVNLLLDLEPFSPPLAELVLVAASSLLVNVPRPDEWKTFTITTTAMPDNVTARVQNDTTELFERAGWAMWKALQAIKAPRLPGFGDYGIDNPNTDLDQPFYNTPIPMIRYTTPEQWAFFRGTSKPAAGARRVTDWPELARRLIGSGHYRGKNFSAGDNFIQDCADGAPKHSGPSQWRQAGVNHHITLVAEQLSSLP